jgi:hypothetical protein
MEQLCEIATQLGADFRTFADGQCRFLWLPTT